MVNLKTNLCCLFILICILPSSSSISTAEACSECFWKYTGDEYYTCINQHCHSIFLTPSSLFSSPSSASSLCVSCSTAAKAEYSTCINQNCKQEILHKALEFSSLHPYSLLSTLPLADKTSFVCQMTEGGATCSKYQWANDEVQLTKFLKSGSRCAGCSQFEGENYRSCATFHCREEIEVQLAEAEPLVRPVELSGCTDACYQGYLDKGRDFSACVKMNCKATKLGMVYKEGEMKLCSTCRDLADSRYMSKCVQTYCKEEILSQLVKNDEFIKLDCETMTPSNWADSCGPIYVRASYEFFSSSDLVTGEKLNECGHCTQIEGNEDHQQACVLIYCPDKVLDKSLYLTNTQDTFPESSCLNECLDSKGLNAICYSTQCKTAIKTLYNLYLTDLQAKEKLKSSDCALCLQDSISCKCRSSCKSQITSKQVLFAPSQIELSSHCQACLNFEGFEYHSCVSNNCQTEIDSKTLLVAATAPETLLTLRPLGFTSCKSCATYYTSSESRAQYECLAQNCKSEFFNKDKLINTKTESKCSQCVQFSGEEFHNCAFFFCKSAALAAFESYKADESLSLSPSIIKLNECTDSCYYDWYYYGYDYDTCAYKYCRKSISNPPLALISKIEFSDYLSMCSETGPLCVANLCQFDHFREILISRQDFQCKICTQEYKSGKLSVSGLSACMSLNCMDQLQGLLKQSGRIGIVLKNEQRMVVSEEDLIQVCGQALNGEIDVDYRACYPVFNSLVSKPVDQNRGVGWLITAGTMAGVAVVVAGSWKIFKKLESSWMERHSYKLL